MENKITSEFIRNALGDLRMTGRQLAKEIGVTEETVSLWKNGKVKMSYEMSETIRQKVMDYKK